MRIISYIIYEYSEDMLTAKKFPHRTWFLNKMEVTFRETTEIFAFKQRDGTRNAKGESKSFAEYRKRFSMYIK